MDDTFRKNSGADAVLQGAMKGALKSGLKPSELLVAAAATSTVEKSDVMGILRVAMRLALDHGTEPNELINVAVEEAFKNQNPSLKRAVSPDEQPNKRIKTATTKDGQKHEPNVADSDGGSPSKIGLSSNVQTLPGIRIIKMECKASSKNREAHHFEALREYPGREI